MQIQRLLQTTRLCICLAIQPPKLAFFRKAAWLDIRPVPPLRPVRLLRILSPCRATPSVAPSAAPPPPVGASWIPRGSRVLSHQRVVLLLPADPVLLLADPLLLAPWLGGREEGRQSCSGERWPWRKADQGRR